MAMTRIASGTRMFITGDLRQTDLNKVNGLKDFVGKLKDSRSDMIALCEFANKHIERDPVVAEILKIYGDE